ncbi:MAG: HEAT repeat domain-containing protein, partial [Candidatus Solibacter sp.]|nr:HEAT repeat domain-containing protein [Candidatus Solibacter sp.]
MAEGTGSEFSGLKATGLALTPVEQRTRKAIIRQLEESGSLVQIQDELRRVRDLIPQEFTAAAMSLLDGKDMPGCESLLTDVLLESPAFVLYLTAPDRFDHATVIAICRDLLSLNPSFDIKLARLLPKRYSDEHSLETATVLAILDILNEISTGPRLIPVLKHLEQHADERIASKVLLLLGSRLHNRHWLSKNLQTAEPRARASLVESLWRSRSDNARRVFAEALHDGSSRVVGNALVGLFLAGEPGIAKLALKMLRDPRPSFRWTAAWVLGTLADTDHLDALRVATADADPGVQRSALRAVGILEALLTKPDEPQPVAEAAPAT